MNIVAKSNLLGRVAAVSERTHETNVQTTSETQKPKKAPFLGNIASITRRPPTMSIKSREGLAPDGLQLLAEHRRYISQMSTNELAYAVSEFLVRRGPDLSQSDSKAERTALAELDVAVRMFEHLYILQTRQNG